MKYIYTVTNVSPTTDNINSLSRTWNGNVKDFTSALDTTELVPLYDFLTTEIVLIDICREETTFSVSAEVYTTSPIGKICEDMHVYKFDVENIFDVEVEVECVFGR